MNQTLIIFEDYADDANCPAERGLRIEWGTEPPKVGKQVSMGQAERWYVSRVSCYESSLLHDLYLVEVGLDPCATIPENYRQKERPYIGFSEAGSSEWLMMGWMVDPEASYPSGQIIRYIPMSENDVRQEALPWQVASVEMFVKIDEHAPYQSVAVCWCTPIPERELVAA